MYRCELRNRVRPAILRSCLRLSGDKISSTSICIHQPQGSITRHAQEFGTLIIENRRIASMTPICLPHPSSLRCPVKADLPLWSCVIVVASPFVFPRSSETHCAKKPFYLERQKY